MKKIMSLLLCLTLVFGLIPGVFAAEGGQYLALGDSITGGTGLKKGESSFPEILAAANGWELTNMGTDGVTAGDLYQELSTGSLDEAIANAEIITITAGGNDVMDALYEMIVERYNATFGGNLQPDDVITILKNNSDTRWMMMMLTALAVLTGDPNTNTPAFADHPRLQEKIDECVSNLEKVVTYIRGVNRKVAVIIPTQYNPYKKSFTGELALVASSVDTGAMKLNSAITANGEKVGYLVADVFTAFDASSENLCNATMKPIDLDFHPNAKGHQLIAEVMQDVIDNMPEPTPFDDVPADSFFYEPVLWAVENGITNGASDYTFDPTGKLQRAQFVTMLWRAAGSPEPTSTENPFSDVKEKHFFYKAVLWAVENGITNGVSATEFGSYATTNRAQAVTFLWRYLGKPESTGTNSFTDVESGLWYEAPINWAVEMGVTNGLGDGTFGIDTDCNRAHAVTFLYRALNK